MLVHTSRAVRSEQTNKFVERFSSAVSAERLDPPVIFFRTRWSMKSNAAKGRRSLYGKHLLVAPENQPFCSPPSTGFAGRTRDLIVDPKSCFDSVLQLFVFKAKSVLFYLTCLYHVQNSSKPALAARSCCE